MGDSHAWAGIYAWNPHVQLSALLKSNKQAVAYAQHMVNNPRGLLPTQLDAIERRDRLPICCFAWGTAMHGRTPMHGTPMYSCPPFETQWTGGNSCLTHDKKREGHAPTHPDACERRVRLPMCGYSWGTAMHGRITTHNTPMHGCPPYWNSICIC